MRLAKALRTNVDLSNVIRVESEKLPDGGYKYTLTAPGEPFALRIADKDKSKEMAAALAAKHNTVVVTTW